MKSRSSLLAVALACVAIIWTASHTFAQTLDSLTVVKTSEGIAVVRLGAGALKKVKVGDRLGETKAIVKEIASGRVVLEETFKGADGRPNRALIVIKEGERGGTRYLQRSDELPMVGIRLVPTTPPASKPVPPKKP